MTLLIHTINELQNTLNPIRSTKKIALVPTMGNLHAGHLSLVSQAKKMADIVVVTLFVNPTQFSEGEDFESYPRTLENDVQQLSTVDADFVFAPSVNEMYPNYPELTATQITLGALSTQLCGKSRLGHFDGVGLIVSKLFNIVQPHLALFGKKDYQQLALIRQLVADLSYPIDIIGGDIVRNDKGLALSSRNQYLTEEETNIAPKIHQTIQQLAKKITHGEHFSLGLDALITDAKQQLEAEGFRIDYLEVHTQKLTTPTMADKKLVVLVAVWLGKARLLDNQEITVEL